jgi:hypothetical protein
VSLISQTELVGYLTKRKWKKISETPSWSNCGTATEFLCRTERKKENFRYTLCIDQWIQTLNVSAVQSVQINDLVVMWSNVVSYLARIIINDISIQISLKRIRLHIKAKLMFYDKLGQKTQQPFSSSPQFNWKPSKKFNTTTSLPRSPKHFYIEQHASWIIWRKGT